MLTTMQTHKSSVSSIISYINLVLTANLLQTFDYFKNIYMNKACTNMYNNTQTIQEMQTHQQ